MRRQESIGQPASGDDGGRPVPVASPSSASASNRGHAAHVDAVHVVEPSWQPLILAVGITLTLAGTIVTPIMWIVGLVVVIVAGVNWVTELRRDYHPASNYEEAV